MYVTDAMAAVCYGCCCYTRICTYMYVVGVVIIKNNDRLTSKVLHQIHINIFLCMTLDANLYSALV